MEMDFSMKKKKKKKKPVGDKDEEPEGLLMCSIYDEFCTDLYLAGK